jgi:superfamily II DNA or RNA helicase
MIEFDRGKKRLPFRKNFTTDGIVIEVTGPVVPVFPLSNNDPETVAKLMPEGVLWAALERIWSDGLLRVIPYGSWVGSFDIYEKYDPEEDSEVFEALDLPLPSPMKMEAISSSHVGDPAFRVRVEASHPQLGPLREDDPPRIGPVFLKDTETIIPLSREQRVLFDLAKGQGVDWSKIEERMAYLAKCKAACIAAGASLDGYLSSEEYEFRTDAKIDLREDSPEKVTLVPVIEGLDEYDPQAAENLAAKSPRPVFTKVTSPTRRKRLVLDKGLRERLSRLPPKGRVTGSDVPRLLTNPDQVVPEGFDLSLFSERVKGIKTRVYNSRPYIHVSRSRGGWFEGIPGISLDDWSPGEEATNLAPSDGPKELSPETYQELARRAKDTGDEYVLHGGSWIRIDPDTAHKFQNTVDSLERRSDGSLVMPAGSVLDIYDNLDLLEFVDRKSLAVEEAQLPDDLPRLDPPNEFVGSLFPYQMDGYRWLTRLFNYQIGGLLADDMGLGKTVQAIAHLLYLKENGTSGPHLIVVPKTLVENWHREIQKFSKGLLKVWPYVQAGTSVSEKSLRKFDVVLTTYEVLRRDQVRLGKVPWTMVICDEAQFVKNPTAQRTSAVKAMKSRHRAALTGTPVENGLIEFWCIMDFVQPGLLGSWADFRTKYERPIVAADDKERDTHVKELLQQIRGYYLRRLKSEYLSSLPAKTVEVMEVPLSDEQLNIYREIARIAKAGGRGAALGAIQRLLIVSAHPSALGFSTQRERESLISSCPKLKAALDIVEEVKAASEKVIIFTDFKNVQRILQQAILERFGIWPDVINGDITQNRQIIIDIFAEKDGFNTLILGHQVGGVGLNITAANHVIHYTRPWNPAKENQATDRVHRIGQDKLVKVYYPIARDERFVTVEARLDELIKAKENLARDVLRPSSELAVKPEELLDCLDVPEN